MTLDEKLNELVQHFSMACCSPESLEALARELERHAENQRKAATLWRKVGTARFTERKGAVQIDPAGEESWKHCGKCAAFGTNSAGPAAHIPGCTIRPELRK